MDIVEDLALTCVKAAMAKEALDDEGLSETRSRFEHSIGKEQSLRRHAERLKSLAAQRAEEEDTSLGGYAGTAATRLAPIPQTLGEAAWRLPAVAAGGGAGYALGRQIEGLDPLKLNRFSPVSPDSLASVLKPISGAPPKSISNLFNGSPVLQELGQSPVEDLAALLQKQRVIPLNAQQQALAGRVEGALPKGKGLPFLAQEVENAAKMMKKPSVGGSIAKAMNPYRWGGAAAGIGAASLLTGLPLAIRALLQKRQGGEAAVRARSSMQKALGGADEEAQKRDEIIGSLPKAAAAIKRALSGSSTDAVMGIQTSSAKPPENAIKPIQPMKPMSLNPAPAQPEVGAAQ